MEPKDRIIVSLDVDDVEEAIALVERLADHVGFFRIGLDFFLAMFEQAVMSYDAVGIQKLRSIHRLWKLIAGRVFWDGRFKDIPSTVEKASKALVRLDVKMFSVHCLGGREMMQAARRAANEKRILGHPPLVLGVTVLQDPNYDNLVESGIMRRIDSTDARNREKPRVIFLEVRWRAALLVSQKSVALMVLLLLLTRSGIFVRRADLIFLL